MPGDNSKLVRMDENAHKKLGERIEFMRERLGISKVDFCHAAGISRPYLDLIERGGGHPSADVLCGVAGALGMTLSELFDGIC